MLILQYFKKIPKTDLQTAAVESNLNEKELQTVEDLISDSQSTSDKKPKKRKYTHYDGFKRAEMAKWAMKHGCRPAGRKFGVAESTIRGIVENYKMLGDDAVESVPKMKRGARTLLPNDVDEKVMNMIKNMRTAGAVISRDTIIALGKGLVIANDRTQLTENGGSLILGDAWAKSISTRMGFVRRKKNYL